MDSTEQVIRQRFQQYYLNRSEAFELPPGSGEREYGFLLFKQKFMVRHRAFREPSALLSAIRDLVPAHVYFSTAHYMDPTAPMEEKGWKQADLVFDIDADHLSTACKPKHDSWKCKGCGTIGKGGAPKLCPKCKNDRIEEQTWLCTECLRHAKEETTKLLDILYSDLAVEPSETQLFFSGHRGYHVHVHSKSFVHMGEEERREIANYVIGQGLEPQLHELDEANQGGTSVITGPQLGQPGWRGRMAAGLYDILNEEGEQAGLTSAQTKTLRSQDPGQFLKGQFWSSFRGIGLSTWNDLSNKAVAKKSAQIDSVVTTDVHRLIRLPGTLNGHTGLLAMRVPKERFEEYDPFRESIAFQGKMKVLAKTSPAFELGDEQFGPYENQHVELPSYAAMLLLCKRRAEPLA